MVCVVMSACLHKTVNTSSTSDHYQDYQSKADLICDNAEKYKGLVVGDGHCVSLIKKCSNAPNTANWRPGKKVYGASLAPGSIIATFKNGRYPSKSGYHAAIYIHQDEKGIWVWDQWQGKAVHKRLIRWNNKKGISSNNGSDYRLVKIIKP